MCGIVAIYSPNAPLPPGAVRREPAPSHIAGPTGTGCGRPTTVALRSATPASAWSIPSRTSRWPPRTRSSTWWSTASSTTSSDPGRARARGHRLRTRSDSEIALHLYQEQRVECLAATFAGSLHLRSGTAPQDAVRGARPVRHQAAVLRRRSAGSCTWHRRSRRSSPPASPRPGTRRRSTGRCTSASTPDGRCSGASGRCRRRTADRHGRRRAPGALLGHSLPGQGRGADASARRTRPRASSRVGRCWTMRCGCGCGPTCPLAACSLAAWTRPPSWAWRRGTASGPVAAFTIGFNQAAYDESDVARATAEHAGAEFHLLPLERSGARRQLRRGGRAGEMLQFNAHGTARYLLSREIQRAGYKTVMAGRGLRRALRRLCVRTGGGRGGASGAWPAPAARLLDRPADAAAADARAAGAGPGFTVAGAGRPGAGVRGPALDSLLERLGSCGGCWRPASSRPSAGSTLTGSSMRASTSAPRSAVGAGEVDAVPLDANDLRELPHGGGPAGHGSRRGGAHAVPGPRAVRRT